MRTPHFSCVDGAMLDTETAYRLVVGCVVPRPVAWITSVDADGRVNAAPFSSYNYVATSPPMLAINIATRPDGRGTKDTANNIRRSREFVVNVATEDTMELMHQSAQEFAPDVSEIRSPRRAGESGAPFSSAAVISIKAVASVECRPSHDANR